MISGVLSEIDPAQEVSWRGKVFITLDVDWVTDEILDYTVSLLDTHNLKCTIFATHASESLEEIKGKENYEIGIHPNYNNLLAKNADVHGNESSLEKLRATFPCATSIRSHSLVQSSRLQNEFVEYGFTHESNSYIPFDSGIKVRPWRIWNGLVKVPFVWADDIHLYQRGRDHDLYRLNTLDFCVIAFHPIHLFLNTDSVATYDHYKSAVSNGQPIRDLVNDQRRGIKDLFVDMMNILF